MAEQLSKLTSIQNNRKYCCDPFQVHKTKRTKDLRLVTAEQAKCNPSLVQVGMKICTNCRKQLQRVVGVEPPLENLLSEEEDDFVPPEIEFESLNETLGKIGESPLSQRKIMSRSRYLPQKKKRVHDTLERKFDAACGSSPSLIMDVSSDEEDGMPAEIVQKLIAKFRSTESRSEKITVLTIFVQTWSQRKIMATFGCSQRMATQAMHLSLEKGILATPNPKTGKKLPENVSEAVGNFYRQDDITNEVVPVSHYGHALAKMMCNPAVPNCHLEYSESEVTREVQVVKAGCGHIELSKITGYVAVVYDSKWWVAYVSSIQPETNEVTISFLHPHGPNPSFVYPEPFEMLVVHVSDVLVQLNPVTFTGRTYTLSKGNHKQQACLYKTDYRWNNFLKQKFSLTAMNMTLVFKIKLPLVCIA
eukprot:gene4766-21070_t